MATATETLLERYGAAWNAHDARACAECFTEDGVRWFRIAPLPLIGGDGRYATREQVEAGIRAFMDALPDMTVTITRAVEGDGVAVLEWIVEGTHTGDWEGWTGQGERVEFPGVSVYVLEDHLIREERMYYDPALMAAGWRPPG